MKLVPGKAYIISDRQYACIARFREFRKVGGEALPAFDVVSWEKHPKGAKLPDIVYAGHAKSVTPVRRARAQSA